MNCASATTTMGSMKMKTCIWVTLWFSHNKLPRECGERKDWMEISDHLN